MKVTVLISFSGAGGVEKMVMNLVREFARTVEQVDLIVIRGAGPHFDSIPNNVSLIQLKSKHTLTAIPELVRYMRAEAPESILVAKDRAARAAVIARAISGVKTRIVVRLGTNLSAALQYKGAVSAWIRKAPMRYLYGKVDAVVGVSQGVADDTIEITSIPRERTHVIRNPVITDEFIESSSGDAPHPWLSDSHPVVMGIGRLSKQKDFPTLIRAFSKIKTDARLIVLGEGKDRRELEELVEDLDLKDRVLMPGFVSNVGLWLSHTDLFVLSSRWEGSPNALTEALALGIPSVSTRCPSGPNELLQEGEYGPLVEMGDCEALATAIDGVLDNPLPKQKLQLAVADYNVKLSAKRYLDLLETK